MLFLWHSITVILLFPVGNEFKLFVKGTVAFKAALGDIAVLHGISVNGFAPSYVDMLSYCKFRAVDNVLLKFGR